MDNFNGILFKLDSEKGGRPVVVGSAESAGFDFVMPTTVELEHGVPTVIDTGVACCLPRGWCGLVFGRSSTRYLSVRVANIVGLIDSDYRGNIMVTALYDRYNNPAASKTLLLEEGNRYFQMVVVPHFDTANVTYVDELPVSERGVGGFGSTNKMNMKPLEFEVVSGQLPYSPSYDTAMVVIRIKGTTKSFPVQLTAVNKTDPNVILNSDYLVVASTKIGEGPLLFTQVVHRETWIKQGISKGIVRYIAPIDMSKL